MILPSSIAFLLAKDDSDNRDEYNDEFDNPEFLHELSTYTDSYERPAEVHDKEDWLAEDTFEAEKIIEGEPCMAWARVTECM